MTSTNLTRLEHFWRAAEKEAKPVTVVAFGDSLQADYRSVETWLFPSLEAALGKAGTAVMLPGLAG